MVCVLKLWRTIKTYHQSFSLYLMVFSADDEEESMSDELLPDMNESKMLSEDIVLEVNPDDYINDGDIFKQISEDLGLSLLPDDLLNGDVFYNGDIEMDDCDSEYINQYIKKEPPSPNSSTESQCSSNEEWTSLLNNIFSAPNSEIRSLETPPTTPPNPPSLSPPVSPTASLIYDDAMVTTVLTGTQFSTTPLNTKQNVLRTAPASAQATVVPNPSLLTTRTPTHSPNLFSNGANQLQLKVLPVPNVAGGVTTTGPLTCALSNGSVNRQSNHILTLPQKGYIKISSAPSGVQPIHYNFSPVTPRNITTIGPTPIATNGGVLPCTQQTKANKRQERMIKNRESACLSRKKKKEYVQTIEGELKQLAEENLLLKYENEVLKGRVSELEKENVCLRSQTSSSSVKKATALVAVVFMITLNLGPLSGIFLSNQQRIATIESSISAHHGRSLLWAPSEDALSYPPSNENNPGPVPADRRQRVVNSTITAQNPTCPMDINRTESLRLESELRGWIFRSEKEDVKEEFPKMDIKKHLPPMPRLKRYLAYEARKNKANEGLDDSSKELQIYQSMSHSYDAFLKTIKHREDTFYVVSFTGNHLLLPATAHNKTTRPRMSLILPALPLNDTMKPPKGHIAMMQIDCEVMNTKLVYVKESMIPSQVRKQDDAEFHSVMSSHSNISSEEEVVEVGEEHQDESAMINGFKRRGKSARKSSNSTAKNP